MSYTEYQADLQRIHESEVYGRALAAKVLLAELMGANLQFVAQSLD